MPQSDTQRHTSPESLLRPSGRPPQSTRREFLALSSAALLGTAASSTSLLAAPRSANEKVQLAAVGVGGKGWSDITSVAEGHDVVAFCDVDTQGSRRGGWAAAAEKWPHARRYTDWREMLDKEAKNLNGLTVSTPDHMHAPVTMSALQRGLATYTQKPLTRTVHEARQLTLAARKAGVATQMGNQGHSGTGYRTLVDWVQRGAIGKVKEAHTWSNRPIWPQGIDRPDGSDPVPKHVSWDLWLGVSPERPYKEGLYHPFKWRGWFDFGAGALGDMGCHIIDPVVWSLELGPPRTVHYSGPEPNSETFPEEETLTYRFPGTKYTAGDSVVMKWYDGGRKPPEELAPLPEGQKLPDNGILMIGEEGVLLCRHGGSPQLLPEEKFKDASFETLPSVNHYLQWTNAIRGMDQTTSHFDYAGPLTETVLLGTVACRFADRELKWDADRLVFTNAPDANAHLQADYRKGWEVAGL